jgi:hypothetical protein
LVGVFGSYMLVINAVEVIVKREMNHSIAELDQQKSKLITLVDELEDYQALYQTALYDVNAKVKLLDKLEIIRKGKPLFMQAETGNKSITKQQLPELAKPVGCAGQCGINKQTIEFKTKFIEPPKVLTTVSFIDFAKGVDHRIKTKVSDISTEGFTLDLLTWCNTSISKVEASWIAVGY